MRFLAIVFLAAAISKAWTIFRFTRVVAYLLGPFHFPPVAHFLFGVAVVAWEAALGAALLLRLRPRLSLACALATLLVFSVALAVLSLDSKAPGCACLGLLMSHAKADAATGLTRNAALAWICVVLLLAVRSNPFAFAPRSDNEAPRASARVGGFTLIELLVCIVILTVLVALSLPCLVGAKGQSKLSRSLSTHRQVAESLALYAGSQGESFPYFQTPGEPTTPARIGQTTLDANSYFNSGRFFWPNLLCPDYFDGPPGALMSNPERAAQLNEMDRYPAMLIRSEFSFSYTAFALPSYWDEDKPPVGLGLLRGTRLADVAFPSLKGLFVDTSMGVFALGRFDSGAQTGTASLGMADGSARIRRWPLLSPESPVVRPFGAGTWPVSVMATRHGLAGRDF